MLPFKKETVSPSTFHTTKTLSIKTDTHLTCPFGIHWDLGVLIKLTLSSGQAHGNTTILAERAAQCVEGPCFPPESRALSPQARGNEARLGLRGDALSLR